MQKIIIGCSLLIGASSFAISVEEATTLFQERTNSKEGVSKALAAADMVKELAKSATSQEEKALLKLQESEYVYFIGNRVSGKDKILDTFERGYEAADFAIKNLNGTKKSEALYWYAANQGRWGETKGVLASLGRWSSEMKPALEAAIALDKTVHSYGPLRIIGKANLKVPGESDKEGLKFLNEAFDKTLKTIEVDGEEVTLSEQVNNTVFLLWALKKKNSNTDKFCEVYDAAQKVFEAGDEAMKALDENSLPETQKEFEDFFSGKGDFEGISDYKDENC